MCLKRLFCFKEQLKTIFRYGSFSRTEQEIQKAAELAESIDFIQQLPDGFNTIVGERGQKLSGGQRQRLCLARAILKDPPILILDEATSNVDKETELAIQRSLNKVKKNRTTIIIAHRLSTITNADIIYVVGNGGIIEQGSHDELLAQKGAYSELWHI
jgi:ATP-binding cassette subfamily B protein